jgi:hypothetical protein
VVGATTLHSPPDKSADFWIEVVNTGNRSQTFLLDLENPQPVRSVIDPPRLSIAPGALGRSRVSIQGAAGVQAQTVRIRTRGSDHQERQRAESCGDRGDQRGQEDLNGRIHDAPSWSNTMIATATIVTRAMLVRPAS